MAYLQNFRRSISDFYMYSCPKSLTIVDILVTLIFQCRIDFNTRTMPRRVTRGHQDTNVVVKESHRYELTLRVIRMSIVRSGGRDYWTRKFVIVAGLIK